MFKKLGIKLTVFNMVVVCCILALIVCVVFLSTPDYFSAKINQEMWMAAFKEDHESSRPFNWGHSYVNADYIYTRIDASGNIVEKSSRNPIEENTLKALVAKAMVNKKNDGEIKLGNLGSFLFLKVIVDGTQGQTIIFSNSNIKQRLFSSLVISAAILISISLILAFLGSRFMSKRALIPIRKAWQRQTDFTADASHELRTPLAIMQANLELVMGNADETVASQKKWLDKALNENKKMAKLIDDLLLLARSDVKQNVLDMNVFLLDSVLKEAIIPFEVLASKRNIKLSHELNTKVMYYGDSNLIKRLLVILTDNALKYTSEGGKVEIQSKISNHTVEIYVSDTGEGIEKEHLDKIFTRFYRVDKVRSRSKGGSGLGLSIAQWIVNEHHGSIRVDSTPGKGSTFVVCLPISMKKKA
ncbi:MAG: ATP-binding protein [Bacillota bacterium]|nr:ATP-binding protein [Bacillota bacterium]